MRTLYTLVLLAVSSFVSAQSFTYGSIFNYNVGDTIIEEYTETPGQASGNPSVPPKLTLRVITNKVIVPTQDTVIYTEQQTINQFQWNGSTYVMGYTNTTVTYNVIDLPLSAVNYTFPMLQCQHQKDTTFIDSCGFNVHVKALLVNQNASCFEPNLYYYTYIDNVGLYKTETCGSCSKKDYTIKNKLVYTNKGNRCGKPVAVSTGLNELKSSVGNYIVYPNPSAGVYQFQSLSPVQITVTDISGRTILFGENASTKSTVDLSNYAMGVYFLHVSDGARSQTMKLVKTD